MNGLGEFIREQRGGRSLREFALLCGVSHTYIDILEKGYNFRSGKKPIVSTEVLKKIAAGIGVDYLYLAALAEQHEFLPVCTEADDMVSIPVLGTVPAGVPVEAIEDTQGWELISKELARRGTYFALIVRGSSMEPRIMPGDTVIVRQQPDVENGDVAVVMVGNEEATVKRVRKYCDGISLLPNNPAFAPTFFPYREGEESPVRIIGKVVELRGQV
ncbi:MAG: XRE family transcriptional regulator [Syntrophomonadaceae bacterium]|nr:XRE family transcriptional regulator [Syntrophomonadaceae bacterium]